jgi:hypothetical protein
MPSHRSMQRFGDAFQTLETNAAKASMKTAAPIPSNNRVLLVRVFTVVLGRGYQI